jgi:hypothetical protein
MGFRDARHEQLLRRRAGSGDAPGWQGVVAALTED